MRGRKLEGEHCFPVLFSGPLETTTLPEGEPALTREPGADRALATPNTDDLTFILKSSRKVFPKQLQEADSPSKKGEVAAGHEA